jgi:hypothetical protein
MQKAIKAVIRTTQQRYFRVLKPYKFYCGKSSLFASLRRYFPEKFA